MNETVDVIVIGAGQAGPSLAVRFAKEGRRVVLIEKARLGGTCVNNGCIPTKTLVASARVAYLARRAADFGVLLDSPVRVDMAAVKARKDQVVQESIDGLTQWLESTPKLTMYRAAARFVGPHTVDLGDVQIEAERIVINVGGRAVVPDWPGLAAVPYLTNSSMMALDVVPEHLVVVGGSYIGIEFAQMMRRFGARVTVVESAPRLIPREDPEISAAIQALLEGEGIACRLGARNLAVRAERLSSAADPAPGAAYAAASISPIPSGERGGGEGTVPGTAAGFTLHGVDAGGAFEVRGSHLLFAIGRRPNTDDLGLDRAGIATDARGYIQVDDTLQTSVPGVWAAGDVNGRGAFTHTAYNDHEIIAANLLDGDARRVSDRIAAYALYTDPPLGRIGITAAEARAAGRQALVATLPMSRVGRARERSETIGMMQVLVDPHTRLILGAALLGVEADEVVQALLTLMYARQPYTVMQRAVYIHPTVSELLPTLLAGLKPLGA